MNSSPVLHATPVDRRRNLAKAVNDMATAIAAGTLTPSVDELRDLIALCDAHRLWPEAARVRRWLEYGGPRISRWLGETF